jgi:hypothetical protein
MEMPQSEPLPQLAPPSTVAVPTTQGAVSEPPATQGTSIPTSQAATTEPTVEFPIRKPTEPTVSPPDVKGKGKGKISRLEAELRASKAQADAQRQQMALLIARIDKISVEEALKQLEEQEKVFLKK